MDMRRITNLNKGWLFTKPGTNPVSVDLPHTWNVQDGADGGNDYWRGICTYERRLEVPAFDRDREEVWLQFDGVNSVADVYVNGKKAAHHEGGYSTFQFAILQGFCRMRIERAGIVMWKTQRGLPAKLF